jgi:hypothetical protein
VQLTSDAWRSYIDAVRKAFGDNVDYAQLLKLFGPSPEGETSERKFD